MKFFKKKQPLNLLELTPVRVIKDFSEDQGIVTLLIPKFKNEAFANWFIPRWKSKYLKIKLDEIGSFVWKETSGHQKVQEICEKLKPFLEVKGETVEFIEEKVCSYMASLYHYHYIDFVETKKSIN
jgi:hypothetical protein